MTIDEIRKQLERDLAHGTENEIRRLHEDGPRRALAEHVGYLEQSIRNAIRELGHLAERHGRDMQNLRDALKEARETTEEYAGHVSDLGAYEVPPPWLYDHDLDGLITGSKSP